MCVYIYVPALFLKFVAYSDIKLWVSYISVGCLCRLNGAMKYRLPKGDFYSTFLGN